MQLHADLLRHQMLYTRIAPTIDTPGGELAVLAIASVAKADEGRDGITTW